MADDLRVNEGDLSRLERGVRGAERAEQSLGRAGRNAERFARELLDKFKEGTELLSKTLASLGVDAGDSLGLINAGADLAGDAIAGARALGSIVPGLGAAVGGGLGIALGTQRQRLRQEGAARAQIQENALFAVESRIKQERDALEARQKLDREATKKAEAETKARTFGGGERWAIAALNRARRSARR